MMHCRFQAALCFLVCLLLVSGWAAANTEQSATFLEGQRTGSGVLVFDAARGVLVPDGLEAPPSGATAGLVDLRKSWDARFPGRGGRANLAISLPPPADSSVPLAVYFRRLGNQARIFFNGELLQTLGDWCTDDTPVASCSTRFDASKASVLVRLPAALWRSSPEPGQESAENILRVELQVQPSRWGGLWPVRLGPVDMLQAELVNRMRWRNQASILFGASLLLLGCFVGALWLRLRDPLYGVFAAAALLGAMRNLDRGWTDNPIPWPLLGALVAATYAAHLALICRFCLLAVDGTPRWLFRLVDSSLLLSVLAAVLAHLAGWPHLWTAALLALLPVALICLHFIVRRLIEGRSGVATALLVAGGLALVAGVHDVGWIRLRLGSGERYSLMPYAMFLFALIMAGIVVQRYASAVISERRLAGELSQRLEQRERELVDAYRSLEAQRTEDAVLGERQRLMREIHDGLGSQLMGLVSMTRQPAADPEALREQALLAMDELRIAVDALQPMEGDLGVVLGSLRQRIQPRLSAAGLVLRWSVVPLPPIESIGPSAAAHVQRIILEALTNVIKHSRAKEVELIARPTSHPGRTAQVIVRDDGVGFDPLAAQAGRGLSNLQYRATSIGAALVVRSAPGDGTSIELTI